MGFYGFPQEGTIIVVSFAYGLPNKPFILQILPHGLNLPKVPKGDMLWQQSESVQQRVDAKGNWSARPMDALPTKPATARLKPWRISRATRTAPSAWRIIHPRKSAA
jgi:hypothetical protein